MIGARESSEQCIRAIKGYGRLCAGQKRERKKATRKKRQMAEIRKTET